MQSRLVNVALSLLLIFFVTELLFCSVAALPDWRKEPMIFPCGSGENVNKGEGSAMIFNCREKEGTASQGTGRGGGAAGTSQVDTFVKSKGMVFVPSQRRVRSQERL